MVKPSVIIICIIIIIGIAGLYGAFSYLNTTNTTHNISSKDGVTYRIALDDANFPPLVVYDEDGEPTGFDIDLILWIGKKMGFNVKLVQIPWDDIFTALSNQEVDMIIGGISITPERLKHFLFSDPYLSISQSIAVGEKSSMFLDDFYAGHGIIGVEGGTTSDDLITELLVDTGILPEEKLIRYVEIEMGAQDLASGKIQFLLSDWPVMVSLVQRFPIHIIGNIDTGEKYGFVFHKDNRDLQNIINQGLEELTRSYDWDTMKHKYLLDY